MPRAGHIVALVTEDRSLKVGLVLSVFMRGKKPQASAVPLPLRAVHTFRAVTMDLQARKAASFFYKALASTSNPEYP